MDAVVKRQTQQYCTCADSISSLYNQKERGGDILHNVFTQQIFTVMYNVVV